MNALNELLARIRPLITATDLEIAAGLPQNALGKHYHWADGKPNGRPCHEKHFPAIVRALCAVFGCIEIKGWRITCDPDGPAIFAAKPIRGRAAKVIETEPGMFEYLQPERRQVYDEFDFYTYFGK